RWHPRDALFAPLIGSDGGLLGVLSVDDPEDGMLPSRERTAMLEAFAVQASIAVEHARAHQSLAESEALLHQMFEEAPVAKCLLDPDGVIVRVNRSFCEFFGRGPDELIGLPAIELADPDDREVARSLKGQAYGGKIVRGVERRYIRADGETRYGRLSLIPIEHASGRAVLFAVVDTTHEREAQAQLQHLALHDALTSLPNRNLIADRLEQALSRSAREGGRVGVLVIDLDHFKLVNDSYGHPVGDQLLVSVAESLTGVLRGADTAGRLGGDEFIVVCEGVEDLQELELIADRLRAAIRVPVTLGDVTLCPSASVGATLSFDGASADELVAQADMALYRAKGQGRGRFEVFDEDMRSGSMQQLEVRAELDQALRRDEFRLHYQPILDVATSRPIGYEALLRWEHPQRGLLYPGDFLDVLTDSELETPVTRWVLRRACADLRSFGDGERLFVSVNLSPRQLTRDGLSADVQAALADASVDPDQLWLEITEHDILDVRHRSSLQSLQDLGCRIALDDFGTGYSGLTYLQQLPADVVKIDRGFVARLATDRVSAGIVAAVTDLAELLELTVVAEGVETEEQLEMLRAMGVGYVQGFLFARPQPAPAAAAAIAGYGP
ncbi:MAG TPA: EAL domain-containing protein, partial [Mycobacteriales bacterium]|nr:EAL domain-containing protein [Mycobacteriales bacterium]